VMSCSGSIFFLLPPPPFSPICRRPQSKRLRTPEKKGGRRSKRSDSVSALSDILTFTIHQEKVFVKGKKGGKGTTR